LVTREFDVNHGADTLNNFTLTHLGFPNLYLISLHRSAF
jgi:hypothetical protein